jgi:integrase/recombinase XerC
MAGRGFNDALEAFGRRLAAEGRSPNTISAYLRDLSILSESLLRSHPDIDPGEVSRAMIDEALTAPQVATSARGGVRSPASMHRFKAAVRSFFTWAERNGIVRENPAWSLTLRRLPRTPPKFLTEAEKRRLLKELRSHSDLAARRDRIIIELFLGTGIRLQELVDLDIEDVDLDAKHLRVRAKGDVP